MQDNRGKTLIKPLFFPSPRNKRRRVAGVMRGGLAWMLALFGLLEREAMHKMMEEAVRRGRVASVLPSPASQ